MKLIPRVLVGAAVPAVLAAVAKHKAGQTVTQLNKATAPELDARLTPPTDVTHGTLSSPDGSRIHYVDTNPNGLLPADGRSTQLTVVLCHGVSGQWWVWSAVIDSLRADYRVIAWDMRGHGQSTAGSAGVTIPAAASDMNELLQQLDLRDAIVVGHSMGGMELGQFLVDHTATAVERLAGAVFLATSVQSKAGTVRSGGWVRNSGALNKAAKLGGERQMVWGPDNSVGLSLMRAAFGPGVTRKMVDDQVRLQNEFPVRSNLQAGASIAQNDTKAALERLAGELAAIPTAVVSGSHDRLTPPVHGRAILSALPHASYVELGHCGHNIMVEDPDAVVQAIRALRTRETTA